MRKVAILLSFILLISIIPPVLGNDYIKYAHPPRDKAPIICFDFGTDSKQWQYYFLAGAIDWKHEFRKYFANNFDFKIYGLVKKGVDCNITVLFEDSQNVPQVYNELNAIGITQCQATRVLDKCMVEIYISRVEQKYFRSTVTHELGHAFGLGHRQVSDPSELIWLVLQQDVMMWQAAPFQHITQFDINAIKNYYGNDGWGGWNNNTAVFYNNTSH